MGNKSSSAADPPSYLEATRAGAGPSLSPVPPQIHPYPVPQTNTVSNFASVPVMTSAPLVAQMQPMMVIPIAPPRAPVGPTSIHTVCPYCYAEVYSGISKEPGFVACMTGGLLLCLGCCFGCCFIPCCIPQLENVHHSCPNCNSHLGTWYSEFDQLIQRRSPNHNNHRRRNRRNLPNHYVQYTPVQ